MTRGVPVIPIGRGAGRVEGPVTEAGRPYQEARRLLLHGSRPWTDEGWPEVVELVIEGVAVEAAQAARAEVIAEIRAGVEGLERFAPAYDGGMDAEAEGRWIWRNSVRSLLLALLPPTEPR